MPCTQRAGLKGGWAPATEAGWPHMGCIAHTCMLLEHARPPPAALSGQPVYINLKEKRACLCGVRRHVEAARPRQAGRRRRRLRSGAQAVKQRAPRAVLSDDARWAVCEPEEQHLGRKAAGAHRCEMALLSLAACGHCMIQFVHSQQCKSMHATSTSQWVKPSLCWDASAPPWCWPPARTNTCMQAHVAFGWLCSWLRHWAVGSQHVQRLTRKRALQPRWPVTVTHT